MNKETGFKSGYAGIVGKPNVGKSTLLNQLVAKKIAAISNKPQTTRNKITGVVHFPGGQIILLDTPGIHKASSKLNRALVKTSRATFNDVDLILFMIDAKQGFCESDGYALDLLKRAKPPKMLIINKIDLVAKPGLLKLIDEMSRKSAFVEIVPVSALNSDGLDILTGAICRHLPEGPKYFPEDMVTDCTERFLIGEIIREKILNRTRMEVPHATAVVVDDMQERPNGTLAIEATIYIEKTSQKKILIGEKGAMLKRIGTDARKEIEKRFADKVYLNLFIKVKSRWREDIRYLKEFGYS
ncbi:MAG: GTPase Era [Nitrospinaceae bacterium]